MKTRTLKYISTFAPIILSVLGIGVLLWEFHGKFNYETKISADVKVMTGSKDNSPHSAPSVQPSATTPVAFQLVVPKETDEEGNNGNITDHWISERTGKSYFILQVNDQIEVFQNNSQHQRTKVGTGARNKNNIVVQFHSTLDEVNGVLKLKITEDGKIMEGYFTVLDDPTKEAVVRMLRTAS